MPMVRVSEQCAPPDTLRGYFRDVYVLRVTVVRTYDDITDCRVPTVTSLC